MSQPTAEQSDIDIGASQIDTSKWWVPDRSLEQPLEFVSRSTLRLATVVSPRLFQGLSFEADALPLSVRNWEAVVSLGRPDMLLVESTQCAFGGDWNPFAEKESGGSELQKIIQFAKSKGIPTVFWFTADHADHEKYHQLAAQFDRAFCSDEREIELLKNGSVDAKLLLPCFQPSISEHYRRLRNPETFGLNILFDGFADLSLLSSEIETLSQLKTLGLSLIECRGDCRNSNVQIPDQFADCVLGQVTPEWRMSAISHCNAYLMFEKSLSTPTEQVWSSLDATGCQVMTLMLGNGPSCSRELGIYEFESDSDLSLEVVRIQRDPTYVQNKVWNNYCRLIEEHTFCHRLKRICEELKFDFQAKQRY